MKRNLKAAVLSAAAVLSLGTAVAVAHQRAPFHWGGRPSVTPPPGHGHGHDGDHGNGHGYGYGHDRDRDWGPRGDDRGRGRGR